MGVIPVLAHHQAEPVPDQLDDVEPLAEALPRERPELAVARSSGP